MLDEAAPGSRFLLPVGTPRRRPRSLCASRLRGGPGPPYFDRCSRRSVSCPLSVEILVRQSEALEQTMYLGEFILDLAEPPV
jgi:hypothetical protein